MIVFILFPLDTFHTPIIPSPDPDVKYSPLGLNTTLYIVEEYPVMILIRSLLDTLHTPIVPSEDPEAKYSPLGENATLVIWD